MPMPVQEYGTMSFGKFDEIQKKGYHAAIEMLEKLNEEGRLPLPFPGKASSVHGRKKGISARRNSI
jgi:lysophospholipid hydrolase